MIFVFFILGSLIGSFALVIGKRLPLKENVITGRSRCDFCHHELAWFELIPIISFLFLRGKCRYCHKRISADHLLIELLSGFLFMFLYMNFGLTYKLGITLVLITVALIIFVSDFNYMIILDSPIIIGSILILIFRFFESGLSTVFYSILYGLILFIIMIVIYKIGNFLFKKESLGGGDIKLGFLMGLTLGYPNIGLRLGLISVVLASFLALPYAFASLYFNKKNELPFGPFLISSVIIVYIFLDKFSNLLVFFRL